MYYQDNIGQCGMQKTKNPILGIAIGMLGNGKGYYNLSCKHIGLAKRDIGLTKRDIGLAKGDIGFTKGDIGFTKGDIGFTKGDIDNLFNNVF